MSSKNGKSGYSHPVSKVGEAFFDGLPNLHALFTEGRGDLVNIKITYRGSDEWLAIAKRYGGDGSLQVIFGGGGDAYSAFLRLDNNIANGAWRADKFADSPA